MWPYDGKRERKSHTGMRHYYYKCGNCKRNGSTVCALKLVRKSLRNVFLKPRQNGLSAQKIPERTQAAWKPKNTVSCSSRCFWVLLLFWLRFFEIIRIFPEIIFAKIPLRTSSKKDTQPPPSGSSLKRQRVQSITLRKRLSICSSTEVPALYEGKEKWFDSLILCQIKEESLMQKRLSTWIVFFIVYNKKTCD